MKTSAIVRLILWGIVALGLTALLVVCLTVNWSNIGSWGFGFGGTTYADSSLYQAGGTTLAAADVRAVEVHWTSGDVRIAAYDGDTVQVSEQASGSLDTDKQLHWRLTDDGRLIVQYTASGWHWGVFRIPHKVLTVQVPRDMAKLDVVMLEVVSADATVEGMQTAKLDANSVSGEVTLREVQADTLDVETVSGNVTASGRFERVDANSVSGEVSVASSVCPNRVDAETVSGSVELTIPENDGFTCELDSVSGDLQADFAATVSKSRMVYGDGSARFDVETVSGDVRIRKAG